MNLSRLFAMAFAIAPILPPSPALLAGPCQSSPIALSPDSQLLLNTNPDANSVTLFDVSADAPRKLAEIRVGQEPNSVAIHPDGRRAFVANTLDGNVAMLDLVARRRTRVLPVGAEPMALCLSPNGTRLYVANAASNSLSVFDAKLAVPKLIATLDLSSVGTSPRAIAVSDNGDANDADETVYVAMFFGQLRMGKSANDEGQDDQREGRVIALSAATNQPVASPNVISLAPMDKTFNGNLGTGFNANGQLAPANVLTPAIASTNPQSFTTPTGAYPNQLAAIVLHPTKSFAYVVSTGASPNGPLRFNQMAQGLVSVFDTTSRLELRSGQTAPSVRSTAPLNLNQGVNLATTPAPRLFMTNPVAMAWRPDGTDAWVVIQNSNLVTRLTADATGVPTISAPLVAGPSQIVRVDLQNPPGGLLAGKAPRGIVIDENGTRAYVSNFVSRSVTVIDISSPASPSIVGSALSSALPRPGSVEEFTQLGAELFFTGRGPQDRMSSESWGGCIVCHPNGRADGVTWMFDAGPRQTIPLDSTFDPKRIRPGLGPRSLRWTRGGFDANGHDISELSLGRLPQRILNWSAVRDENQDFELNTRGVFGGRGLIDDDRLFYAIGGTSGATPTDSTAVQQFHQFTGATTTTNDLASGATLPALPAGRRDFAIATLSDDRVFIIGGRGGAADGTLLTGSGTVLEFNPRLNTLTTRSQTGFTPRHSLGAAVVKTSGGPRIYAIGGYTAVATSTSPTALVEEYNPATNTWRTVASLPTPTAQFGITVAGGINTAEPLQLIHVVSGNGSTEAAPSVIGGGSIVQRFQPDPNGPGTWSAFSVAGLTPRRNHGIATALRGVQSRVFIVGGQDAGGTVLGTVEEYTAQAVIAIGPTTPAGSPFFGPHPARTSLPAARARFGIGSTLSTNQIYVAGGVDGAGTEQTTIFELTIANNGPAAGNAGNPTGVWVTRGNLSGAVRGLQLSTPPGVTNFLPVANVGRDTRQDAIAAWVALAVRSSRAPVPVSDASARRGRVLFGQTGLAVANFSCATCHGGPKWTRSAIEYDPPPSPEVGLGLGSERVIGAEIRQTAKQPNLAGPIAPPQYPGVLVNVGTFVPNAAGGRVNEIRFNAADISNAIAPLGANGFNIPSLLSVHETAPYYYNGLAQTLDQVLDGSQDGNGGNRQHFVSDPQKRADLIRFLRSIDTATPSFP